MESCSDVAKCIMERLPVRRVPDVILRETAGMTFTVDGTGMSGSCVLLFSDRVLKVQPLNGEAVNEAHMLRFLQGKVPVPRLYAFEEAEGYAFTLQERLGGHMLCEDGMLSNPESVIGLCAEAIRLLHAVPVDDCTASQSRLSQRLRQARFNVEHGLVDVENTEPETWLSFENPEALLRYLEENRPEEDLVMTHGDFCLPNLFTEDGRFAGFIDLGKAGPADRWQDIAICLRSLKANFSGRYGAACRYDEFTEDMLLDRIGVKMDAGKCRYYHLLDELF